MASISACICWWSTRTKPFLTRVFNESTGYEYKYVPGDWAGITGGGYHLEYLGPDLSKYSSAHCSNAVRPRDPQQCARHRDVRGDDQNDQSGAGRQFSSAMAPYLDLKLFLTHIAVETYLADF